MEVCLSIVGVVSVIGLGWLAVRISRRQEERRLAFLRDLETRLDSRTSPARLDSRTSTQPRAYAGPYRGSRDSHRPDSSYAPTYYPYDAGSVSGGGDSPSDGCSSDSGGSDGGGGCDGGGGGGGGE